MARHGIAALLVASLFCGACDPASSTTPPSKQASGTQQSDPALDAWKKENAEWKKNRQAELAQGVMSTPPAWAKGFVPPPIHVNDLKNELDVRSVDVRYRVPPDDPKEYLEYVVTAVVTGDIYSSKERVQHVDRFGNWVGGVETVPREHAGFKTRFVGKDGQPIDDMPIRDWKLERPFKGADVFVTVRLTETQAKRVGHIILYSAEPVMTDAPAPP